MWFLILTTIITTPLWFLKRVSHDLGQKNTSTANHVADVLHQCLTGAKLIIAYNLRKFVNLEYAAALAAHARVAVQFFSFQGALPLLFTPLATCAALFVVFQTTSDTNKIADTALILFSLTRVVPLVGILLQSKTSIEGFFAAYQQLDRLRRSAVADSELVGGKPFDRLQDKVEFEKVRFSYHDDQPILEDASFTIERGSFSVFVGSSGSGKSTIINLLMGLDLPDQGRVLIDGVPLTNLDLAMYRRKIGFVPQDPFLFNTSILENLRRANPLASSQEVAKALALANASDFVSQLPDGIDTVVGDRGGMLSGGERQRIALARALIRTPDLLILDEATSALDQASEALINRAIVNLTPEITVVVITHRPMHIQGVHKFIRLQDRKTYEVTGSHRD